MPNTSAVVRSVILFLLAGVCEIGGGWLVWKWLRDHKPGWWGLLGGLVLILYGVPVRGEPGSSQSEDQRRA